MFPTARAAEHLQRLAVRHGIEIVWIKCQWDSEASAGTKQVFCARPTTALRYLIGLHELGHLCDKVAARVVVNHEAAAEAAAWAWAAKHAEKDMLALMTQHQWLQVGRAWLTNVTESIHVIG